MSAFALLVSAFAAVDINTASQQQLEGNKRYQPVRPKPLLNIGRKNGAFKSARGFDQGSWIKAATLNKIKSEISVGGGGCCARQGLGAAPVAPIAKNNFIIAEWLPCDGVWRWPAVAFAVESVADQVCDVIVHPYPVC